MSWTGSSPENGSILVSKAFGRGLSPVSFFVPSSRLIHDSSSGPFSLYMDLGMNAVSIDHKGLSRSNSASDAHTKRSKPSAFAPIITSLRPVAVHSQITPSPVSSQGAYKNGIARDVGLIPG